ncbi:MAG TPA: methionine--tRNA ligase subunit beta [Patescibacteria group bacterium]|nr:methionine--tRNA ligase subunit beta [Patescibacteria group bacterium]
MVTIDDFAKLEFRVGKVMDVKPVEGSEKLLKLTVDLGEEEPRTILSGIAKWFGPEDLIGNSYIFIANLEPRLMMGLESQGMILAADGGDDNGPVPLIPQSEVAPGSKIR